MCVKLRHAKFQLSIVQGEHFQIGGEIEWWG